MAIKTKNNGGVVLDRQAAMQESVMRNSYETGVSVRPFSNKTVYTRNYRKGIHPTKSRSNKLGLKGFVLGGTHELSNSDLTFSGTDASLQALIADKKKLHLFLKSLTYVTQNVSEHVVFIKDEAYAGTIGTYGPTEEALLTKLGSGMNEVFQTSDIKLARLATALKDAAISQGNSNNPAYAMNVAEIYDRLVDYFHAVNHTMVLYYNALGLFGSESDFKAGARSLWLQTDFSELFEPSTKLNFFDKIADLKRALLGQYYFSPQLLDYMDYLVVSKLPNQDAGFRYLVPQLLTNGGDVGEVSYTGADLFLVDQTAAQKYADFKSAVNTIIEYFESPTAKLLAAMTTGFNQFPVITSLPDSYKLGFSDTIIGEMNDSAVMQVGPVTALNIISATDLIGWKFVAATGSEASGARGFKREFGANLSLTSLSVVAGSLPNGSIVYPDVLSVDDPITDSLMSIVGTGDRRFKEATDENGEYYSYQNCHTAYGLRKFIKPINLQLNPIVPHSQVQGISGETIGLDDRPDVPTGLGTMCPSAMFKHKLGILVTDQKFVFGGDITTVTELVSSDLFTDTTTNASTAVSTVVNSAEIALKYRLARILGAAHGIIPNLIGNFPTTTVDYATTSYVDPSSLMANTEFVTPAYLDYFDYINMSKADDSFSVDWSHAKFFSDRNSIDTD
jgi:hypothetical protein